MDDVLRRRSVGAPAARSTLLTVLGEYLLQRPGGAWKEALVGSLDLLGFTPSAARQAVVRSSREGWLEGERVGRRSHMRLTASSAELQRDGARRIYGFGEPVSWDGRWLLGDTERVIGEAWDLSGLREHYEQFVADFVGMGPRCGAAAFAAQTALVHAWRRFPFIDPGLPDDLLPSDWPRRRAYELFRERHDRWAPAAQEHFDSLAP